ncbi:MAG: DDE-type integrase/transposase/recombinase [Magnetococcales bacterium]|nr:DDE-type integrase/transposase/recombinase [Magnetococcales bacterium]
MKNWIFLIISSLASGLRSRTALQLEILALRHQLLVLNRKQKGRPRLKLSDRIFWAWLSRFWSGWRTALVIIKPDTVIRWHREGFRLFWKWKSRKRHSGGRENVPKEVRDLIRSMSQENPLWGAPRIHGELLKLGFKVAQSSVSRYMVKTKKPPSQTWKTFLENHADQIIAMDLFTVPTVFFKILHVLILIDHKRRKIVHFNVTTNPTAAWVSQQIREAFPWNTAPRFLLHDRDPVFEAECKKTIRSMGVEEVITAPASPWQNPYVERMIGSVRRDALDHVIVLNEDHLKRVMEGYLAYYHHSRTHLGLKKDCPEHRPVQTKDSGKIVTISHLGGLHHQYLRKAA